MQFLQEFTPAPSVVNQVIVATVIVHGIRASCDQFAVQSSKDREVEYLNAHGLSTHDESDAALVTTTLGVIVTGDLHEAIHRP